MNTYYIEITDTFGGEANYSWIKRYLVNAKSMRGAINVLAKKEYSGWRSENWYTDTNRYNLKGACICCFVTYLDKSAISSFNGTKYLN